MPVDRPKLVIGLGNPLMGDEGVGWHAVQALAPCLPPDTEALWGGTDLLRLAGAIEGRTRVILVDALLDPGEPGVVSVFHGLAGLDEHTGHAHHLSLAESLRLLRLDSPALDSTRFTLVAISVASSSFGAELSPPLAAALPQAVDCVLRELASHG